MKHICLILFLFIVFAPMPALAAKDKIVKNKYFDALKKYPKQNYVLKDTLEFSVFDMSDTSIVNDSPKITEKLNAKDEVNAKMNDLAKHFYLGLKNEIQRQRVPVTLYPSASPSYASPLKLFIKVKRIHLKPHIKTEAGLYEQPIELRIFGQIKNKKTDAVLVKFYDSSSQRFTLGKNQADKALKKIAFNLMKDLAGFLRTKY